MFTRLARATLRFRWLVLSFWIAAFLLAALFAPRVFSVLKGGGFTTQGKESDIALTKLEELGFNQTTIDVVFHSEAMTFNDPLYQAQVQGALAEVRKVRLVSRVLGPQGPADPERVSADGRTVHAVVWVQGDLDTAAEMVPEMQAAVRQPGDAQVFLTGSPPLFRDIELASEQDLRRGEIITLPLVLLLLLLVFGSIVAAAVPVALGFIAVTITFALIYTAAAVVDLSIFTVNVATFLGLGIAIDYSLLMVNRFREELASQDTAGAVATTMSTAGRAVLFSALTSMLGLTGLLLFPATFLRSIGIGGLLVVAVSLLVALTLTPALLALLGPRINALPLLPRRMPRPQGFWEGMALRVMRRPLLFILPVSVFLVLLGAPFLHVRLGAPEASVLPPAYESRRGWELLTEGFGPGYTTPIVVAVEAEGGLFQPEALTALKRFTSAVAEHPEVRQVQSIVDLDSRLGLEEYVALYRDPRAIPIPALQTAVQALATDRVTLVRVFTRLDGNDPAAQELVHSIRSIQPQGGVLQAWTSGYTAFIMDTVDFFYGRFPWVILFIMGTIYVALLILFRSVVLPLKAIVMNGLSIFASYGALVFVFQDGNLQGFLGFKATGQIELTIPIILFCLLFGLSMDYEVFLLSRMKERYDATGDNTASVAQGLERTGPVITSAALVVIFVLIGFALGDLLPIKEFGVSMALAIAIDVSIVRAILVPALMRLLGDLNWWAPRFMRSPSASWQAGAPRADPDL